MIFEQKLSLIEFEFELWRIDDERFLMLEREDMNMIELIFGCDIEMND
jgi:hypothetical protein